MDASSAGDTTLVARGTYTWTAQGAIGHSMIHVAPGVVLRSEAGPEATILDAEGQGRVLLLLHVRGAHVEGLTLQNGLSFAVAGDPPLFNFGAGIYSVGESQPTISNCIVRNNHGTLGSAGAGICCTTAAARIERCLVTENWGDAQARGGGIACVGGTIAECTVTKNGVYDSEGAFGGGIYAKDCTIADCVVAENEAAAGRGASGGGIYVVGSSTSISRCAILRNSIAASVVSGGGLRILDGHCDITDCILVANEAAGGSAALGAAIGLGGQATVGVFRCTILGNVATGIQEAIGGIYTTDGRVSRVESSIIAGNVGTTCAGSALEFSCTDLFGNSLGDTVCGTDRGGNFSADPEFCAVDPAASMNFALQGDSPCAPGNHPSGVACGQIGAAAVGCQSVSILQRTWGDVKTLYRR